MRYNVHFNLQFINRDMCGEIEHTVRKHIEWATIWYIIQDHSMNICKEVVK